MNIEDLRSIFNSFNIEINIDFNNINLIDMKTKELLRKFDFSYRPGYGDNNFINEEKFISFSLFKSNINYAQRYQNILSFLKYDLRPEEKIIKVEFDPIGWVPRIIINFIDKKNHKDFTINIFSPGEYNISTHGIRDGSELLEIINDLGIMTIINYYSKIFPNITRLIDHLNEKSK